METTPVDWKNTVSLHEAFWNWKLAASSVPWAKRTPNMPSELTEAIVCLCTGAKLISKGHGDILLRRNKIGEVKGTISSDHDLSTFTVIHCAITCNSRQPMSTLLASLPI